MLRICLFALGLIGSVHAAELQLELKKCRSIQQEQSRLQCYDSIDSPAVVTASSDVAIQKAPAVESPTTTLAEDPNQFGRKITVEELGPEQVEMTIAQLAVGPLKKYTLTMTNGQVWKQSESASIQLKTGDVCILSKGFLGAFYLQKKGSSKRIRVKRDE